MSDAESNRILEALAQSQSGPTLADQRISERCRDIALGTLSGALKSMLEKLVDEFFVLAEKSVQHQTQNLYLEAMSIARDKRAVIEEGFRQHFIREFDAAIKAEQQSAQVDLDENALTLVEPDDLEETIAIREMVAKIEGNCRDEIFALEKRVGVLLQDESFAHHHNPLGAEILVKAYIEACRETGASLKVRLLFVTMWDKHMQNGVVSTYHELNQYLVEKGILPKIRRDIKRQGLSSAAQFVAAAAQAAVEAVEQVDGDGADFFATMQQLFNAATARGGLAGMSGGSMGIPQSGGMVGMQPSLPSGAHLGTMQSGFAAQNTPASVEPSVMHNPLVLTQLTQLQHGAGGMLAGQVDLTQMSMAPVSILRDLKQGDMAATLGSADAMTIDIVAMLFDFIFDDPKLPDPIKALMGRLQIPVLKAALLDQAFFSKKSHPTRRLLNVMAEAAVGWGETIDHDSVLYRKIDDLIVRILDKFEDNLAVFEQSLDDFERFMVEQERTADALVEASVDMIGAREREAIQLEEAQEAAETAVRARANDIEVPEAVRLFLCQEWIKPLRAAYLSGRDQCPAWHDTVGLMDDLIWSVRPKLSKESRQYLVKTLPGLLRRLQDGMTQAGITQEARNQFMSHLVKCHANAVKAGFHQTTESQPVPGEAWKEAAKARQAAAMGNDKPDAGVVLPFVRPVASKDQADLVKLEIIKPADDAGKIEIEEITIGSVAWVEEETFVDVAERAVTLDVQHELNAVDEAEARQLVTELRPGTWIEFQHDGEVLQAKLKWISPLKSAYLFTDRQGKRAATMPQDKLVAAFRIGSARMIDDAPLLDRAVDDVLDKLKKAAA